MHLEAILFNPNPIGIYGGLESIGGGPIWPPPQISAMNAPIDAKIGTDVEPVIKNKNLKKKLNSTIIFFLNN